MTDGLLIATDRPPPPARRRSPWLPVALGALILAVIAGAGWWWSNRATIPDWERLSAVAWAAPAGDAFAPGTPWVQIRFAPLRPGEDTTFQATAGVRVGTPIPGAAPGLLVAMSVQPLTSESNGGGAVITADDSGQIDATLPIARAGWYRISAEVADAASPAVFYVLVPDPNINGPNAVPAAGSSAEAEAVFQRGLAATTALQSVLYLQWIGDGAGNSAVSEHAVFAGDGERPPAMTFRITGGMEAVLIGSTRWVRPPGDRVGWQQQEGNAFVPPSGWADEYSEAANFTLLGEETIDGEQTQIVAFLAPELSDPRRRTAAWYIWWVGVDSGQVRREAMVSRRHYMYNQFSGFNEPLDIRPPVDAATPAPAATPVP